MKKVFLVVLLFMNAVAFGQQNIQLKSHLSYGSSELANIGGYVDHSGNEYALVGTDQGLDIVDVTNPTAPIIKFTVPGVVGPNSSWREVKTYRDYAYITTEQCCDGLQIVDLSNLPVNINIKTYKGDGAIKDSIRTSHALHIDTAKAMLYLYGSNVRNGATGRGYPLFLSLADPWNPVYVGRYVVPLNADPYVHDGYVENDTGYFCHIYTPGYISIVDLKDKSNPKLLATINNTPSQFPHNAWLSVDHKTLFTTDEKPNSYLTAFDISDLSNITELSRFQTDPGSNSIVHNVHILNDWAVTSWYTEGVVITDVHRPDNPVEVGHYDTYPTNNGGTFNGDWGVYPYLPSGNLVVSDIDNGLFVLGPTYVRACYLEGVVTDSITNALLNGATVQIVSPVVTRTTDILGQYKTGLATAGTYSIQVSQPGYITKTINGISLTNGNVTILNVQLARVPVPPDANFDVSVTNTCTGPIQFTDTSAGLPKTWLWNFGDGSTSTLQNPTHVYTTNGQFTVSLKITNDFGVDSISKTKLITVNRPAAPVSAGASICKGDSAVLTATGNPVINWYNAIGTLVDTGSSYTTPILNTTSVYYVESNIYPAQQKVGPVNDSIGMGGIFSMANFHGLYFDAQKAFTLLSVKVYAQGAGNRTIVLLDSNNVQLKSTTVNIPDGVSRVILNFPVAVGTNYILGIQGNVNLFRNNSGVNYPYTINNVVSITNSDAGSQYYYYFYDWIIQAAPCISPRVADTVKVSVCAGIEETGLNNFGAYPNPVRDHLTMTFGGNQLTANLYDITGKNIAMNIIPYSGYKWDLTALPEGVYILVVTDDRQTKESFKLIKL